MFASSALAVLTIVSPDMRMWANLPITMQHFGVMLSVFPASRLMMARGRKFGFRSGSAMGMVGASLAAIGLGMGSFPVMCVGGLFLGYGIANMQLYRFAAVELAPGHFRAQAISYVTAGGVLAGVSGPPHGGAPTPRPLPLSASPASRPLSALRVASPRFLRFCL